MPMTYTPSYPLTKLYFFREYERLAERPGVTDRPGCEYQPALAAWLALGRPHDVELFLKSGPKGWPATS